MDEASNTHEVRGYRPRTALRISPTAGPRSAAAGSGSRILDGVSSPLSAVPIAKRRQLAATLGLFAVLFVAVGVVATTGNTPGVVRVFSAIAILVAVLLGLCAWGVAHSIRLDLAEQQLDAAIDDVLESTGGRGQLCGCGEAHDPDLLHVTDETCEHDGTGSDCTHSCQSCVLAMMRPSPHTPRAERLDR